MPRAVLLAAMISGLANVSATGCRSGEGAGVRAGSIPSVAESAKPAASAALTGPARRPPTERGRVLAAVHRYYRVINALHQRMDAAALASLFTATCPCQAQAAAVRQAAARGEHFVDHAALNVLRPSLQGPTHAFVLVNLDTGRGGLVGRDGDRVTSSAPKRGVQRVFRLALIRGRWLINQIDVG